MSLLLASLTESKAKVTVLRGKELVELEILFP